MQEYEQLKAIQMLQQNSSIFNAPSSMLPPLQNGGCGQIYDGSLSMKDAFAAHMNNLGNLQMEESQLELNLLPNDAIDTQMIIGGRGEEDQLANQLGTQQPKARLSWI